MADIAELAIRVETLELQNANRDMDKFGKTAKSTAASTDAAMRKMGNSIKNTIGALGIAKTIQTVIANTVEQERVIAQLDQTLRSTGRYTEELSQQMQDFASSLQGVTTYGDEAVIASQALLLTFTRIGGDTFTRAQKAILDVATAMGQDLQSATLQVGKALNDPILGMTALSRSGIQFTESQKEVVKQLVETGREAEAQAIILAELETQFGGSAAAAKNTLGGALQSLKNAFGDLLEGDTGGDGVRGATEAINDLTDLLNDPRTKQGFATITQSVLTLTQAAAQGIVKFAEFGEVIGETLGRLAAGSDDPLGRINDELEDANARLAFLGQELNRPRLLRTNPFASTTELEAEWTLINNRINELEKIREDFNKNPIVPVSSGAGGGSEPMVPVAPGIDTGGGISDELKKQQEQIAKTIAGYQLQADTLGMTATEVALYKLQLEGASDAQIQLAASLLSSVDNFEMQAKAAEEAAAAMEQAGQDYEKLMKELSIATTGNEEIDRLNQLYAQRKDIIDTALNAEYLSQVEHNEAMMLLDQETAAMRSAILEKQAQEQAEASLQTMANIVSITQSQISTMQGLFDEGTAIGKAFYVASQALAAANAVIQGFQSAMAIRVAYAQMAAMAGPGAPAILAAGEAHAGVAQAMGFATAGMITAQTISSFDGGGYTGNGSRTGGLDGKGGFMAMMHPRETVIDHTKGQGIGSTNNVNVNVNTNGQPMDRRSEASISRAVARGVARANRNS